MRLGVFSKMAQYNFFMLKFTGSFWKDLLEKEWAGGGVVISHTEEKRD